ncbi:hypothetical protein RMATCC62417_00064 [Rhizopus microsporus]|nr:hypothetical protein RMATCC62417_00064 [Rhizopus microsporus]
MSNTTDMNRTALIFGATGAVGKQLLVDVLKNGSYSKVIAAGRRPVDIDASVPQDKLVQKTIDFEKLDDHREDFRNVSDVYCCLGTTRADAGSAEKFTKVDQEYVVQSAKVVAEENKSADGSLSPVHFLYCSAMNADKHSMFLYPKSKGQTEERIKDVGFERVSIFRPGFLKPVEPRPRSRPLEAIALAIFPPINNFFGLNKVNSVDTVGSVMRKVAEDKSIKPSVAKNIETTAKGTTSYTFTSDDIEHINH